MPLNNRQHEELLLFTSNNLQDIRDSKSDQRNVVLSTLALYGFLISLWEKIVNKNLQDYFYEFMLILSIIALIATILVFVIQKKLLMFRNRQKRILDSQFDLDLEPITGTALSYQNDEKKSFSLISDLFVLHIFLLLSGYSFALMWVMISL